MVKLIDVTNPEVSKSLDTVNVPKKYKNIDMFLKKLKDVRYQSKRSALISLVSVLLGLIITIVSYNLAKDSGGTYYIWWGISAIGLIGFMRNTYTYYFPFPNIDKSRIMYLRTLGINIGKAKATMLTLIWTTIVIALSFILVGIFAEGIYNGGYSSSSMSDNDYKELYLSNSIKNCVAEGGNEAYCRCASNYLVGHNSAESLKSLDIEYSNNPDYISPLINEAAQSCSSLIN
jgi:hypothetical protein